MKIAEALRKIGSEVHREVPLPKSRNLVMDFVYEGRRKNLFHIVFDADIDAFMKLKAQAKKDDSACPSVTPYVASCFAQAVAESPEVQAYRGGFGRKLVIFDDVDVVFIVEKKVEGRDMAWTHTIRACNEKSPGELNDILKRVKSEPPESTSRWLFLSWVMRQPRFIRRLLWVLPRHNPFLMKYMLGTVVVTSVGMFTEGSLALFPVSPLMTLAIGGIVKKPVPKGSGWAKRDHITLTLCVDHDVVDGAPLVRFADAFKAKLADPQGVLSQTDA